MLQHDMISDKCINPHLRYQILSDNQIKFIINSTFEVLERTGSLVKHPEAVELLKKAGCIVEGELVKVPQWLIENALKNTPSQVILSSRNGERKLFLEGSNTYFGNGLANPFFVDIETGERRPVVKSDVFNTARLSDALPNIDFVMSLAGLTDCHPSVADVHEMHAMLQSTTKPIAGWATGVESLSDIIDMCSVVAGGLDKLQSNPFLIVYAGNPVSPLIHPEDALAKLLFTAENGLPVIYASGLQLGAVSPVTLAGTLVVGLAEQFVGLTIAQLKRPNTGYLASIGTLTLDMKTMNTAFGGPELPLSLAAAKDIFRYLNIPTWSIAGATDSKTVDQQSAIESTVQIFMALLSGGNLVHDIGFLEGAMSGALEQIVMSDEIISYVRKMVSGIEVNNETIGLDVIKIVRFLDERGALLIQKGVQIIAEKLNVSRYTIYNYLNEINNKNKKPTYME